MAITHRPARPWQRARTQLAQLKDLSGWANVQARVALARASLLLGDRAGAETVLVEARGFLVRQPDAVRAICQVDEVSELVAQMKHQAPGGSSSLTTAELRVLHYLPTNLTLAAIGSRLYVSRYTVKTHCQVDLPQAQRHLAGRGGRHGTAASGSSPASRRTTDADSPGAAPTCPPLERQGGRAAR